MHAVKLDDLVEHDKVKAVQYLLEHGVLSIDQLDSDGKTALWHAIRRGNRRLAHMLVTAGASLDMPTFSGLPQNQRKQTVFACAVQGGQIDIIKDILQCADEDKKWEYIREVLEQALKYPRFDIVSFLMSTYPGQVSEICFLKRTLPFIQLLNNKKWLQDLCSWIAHQEERHRLKTPEKSDQIRMRYQTCMEVALNHASEMMYYMIPTLWRQNFVEIESSISFCDDGKRLLHLKNLAMAQNHKFRRSFLREKDAREVQYFRQFMDCSDFCHYRGQPKECSDTFMHDFKQFRRKYIAADKADKDVVSKCNGSN